MGMEGGWDVDTFVLMAKVDPLMPFECQGPAIVSFDLETTHLFFILHSSINLSLDFSARMSPSLSASSGFQYRRWK